MSADSATEHAADHAADLDLSDESPESVLQADSGKAWLPKPEGLRQALAMYAAGVDLQHQRLRRLHPDRSDEEVLTLLHAWMHREGEPGDAPGTPRALPAATP